jgi:phosphoglycolate phosphatase
MPLPRLLVFDLDGTLIDSSLDLCNSVNAALAHVGRLPLPNDVIASHIGDGAAMLVRRSLDSSQPLSSPQESDDVFANAYEHFFTYYRAHKLDHTRCYPGVLDTLKLIRDTHPNLPMAVLTNKPVEPSRNICAALGLAPFFFQNYGGNSFPTKKPDPEGLLALIAEANVTPADTVMIGDSDVDILTARRCGARSLGCNYGLAPEALAASSPDATVNHPTEWPTALGLF